MVCCLCTVAPNRREGAYISPGHICPGMKDTYRDCFGAAAGQRVLNQYFLVYDVVNEADWRRMRAQSPGLV
jgi:hypothetical protein